MLNASIENLIGFLDDDPIAYRKVGLSDIVKNSKVRSKELVKGILKNSKYAQFVGKDEDKVALRRDIYNGKYKDMNVNEITETPWERFFLASMNIINADEEYFTFQGKEYSATEFQQFLKENDYSMSGSGAIYQNPGKDNEYQGLIPSYLEYLFLERKKVKKIMGRFYRFRYIFMVGLHILSFPSLLFFLHNIKSGWRRWYRPWRNNLIRFGGWITVKQWMSEFKKDKFLQKLKKAKEHIKHN